MHVMVAWLTMSFHEPAYRLLYYYYIILIVILLLLIIIGSSSSSSSSSSISGSGSSNFMYSFVLLPVIIVNLCGFTRPQQGRSGRRG